MDDEQKNYTLSYGSYNSILVINQSGIIKKVYTPFLVFKIDLITSIKKVFVVDEVKTTKEDKLVFVISQKAYYHSAFMLDIHF